MAAPHNQHNVTCLHDWKNAMQWWRFRGAENSPFFWKTKQCELGPLSNSDKDAINSLTCFRSSPLLCPFVCWVSPPPHKKKNPKIGQNESKRSQNPYLGNERYQAGSKGSGSQLTFSKGRLRTLEIWRKHGKGIEKVSIHVRFVCVFLLIALNPPIIASFVGGFWVFVRCSEHFSISKWVNLTTEQAFIKVGWMTKHSSNGKIDPRFIKFYPPQKIRH